MWLCWDWLTLPFDNSDLRADKDAFCLSVTSSYHCQWERAQAMLIFCRAWKAQFKIHSFIHLLLLLLLLLYYYYYYYYCCCCCLFICLFIYLLTVPWNKIHGRSGNVHVSYFFDQWEIIVADVRILIIKLFFNYNIMASPFYLFSNLHCAIVIQFWCPYNGFSMADLWGGAPGRRGLGLPPLLLLLGKNFGDLTGLRKNSGFSIGSGSGHRSDPYSWSSARPRRLKSHTDDQDNKKSHPVDELSLTLPLYHFHMMYKIK